MTQTLALLLDAYRELNSKKLFWITLMLSAAVVAAFAGIGVNEHGMTVFWWEIPIPGINNRILPPETFYKFAFVNFGIKYWLSWAAAILALVSTAPIFPDFLAGGAIELVLSKPIGRLRLFLTKYLVGLLFVTLQVGIFSAACFVVIGVRGHAWDFRLFVAIPIVVCFFSYLFSICVLLGIVTRSTIASLLVTLLIWFFIFMLSAADAITLTFREQTSMQVESMTKQIQRMEVVAAKELDKKNVPQSDQPIPSTEGSPSADAPHHQYTPEELDSANPFLASKRHDLEDVRGTSKTLTRWNNIFVGVKTALPKTGETIELLKRALLTHDEMTRFRVSDEDDQSHPRRRVRNSDVEIDQRELAGRVEDLIDKRSVGWVIGTSLGFEAIVLAIAAWMFARRDF
jgi:ABC-type transport system involved in multi-copper enzyme maturation permease subunit